MNRLTEQEIYRSILEKMRDQTETQQINNSQDFIKRLTKEMKQANLLPFKKSN
ncbi:hypothetical protein MUN88_20135 [Gracilibacillus caseinilyticus]|uniref:Uncharacterized protein n=1 Tax=Gracilibacillus caseinilyticus TaxID=2932256 RepID=A0ABY4EVJ4_9BACI|nr:hypothetical protein [Gracilibacillus caseinilyticus]UOQ48319.1 hypothetical protein MUN88_20135 [Gracilibacillus caseinilyticus]